MPNNEIIIEENSGISAEEQQEIMAQIDGIAEKNRRQLSENAPVKKEKIAAKKKGFVFPLAVNIAAAAVLCLGGFLLVSFNSKVDEQVRTGNVVYNVTERALIDEIRRETEEQIAAKEMEIAAISARMEEIDNELLLLYSSNINLSSEQIEARERLLAMQSSFRSELSVLNNERSQILETSRAREAKLRAQLEERTQELTAAQRVSGELEAAAGELEKLSGEQAKIAAIDAHFSGGVALIGDLVRNNRFEQASQSLTNLRDFVNNNLSPQTASFRVKRDYYTQTLNAMDLLILDAYRNSAAGKSEELLELTAQNKELQENIAGLKSTIDTMSSGSSGQSQRIREMETAAASLRDEAASLRTTNTNLRGEVTTLRNENNTLRNTNTRLDQSSGEKDKTISSLQTDNTALTSKVSELTSNNAELTSTVRNQEQQILNLRTRIANSQQALQDD